MKRHEVKPCDACGGGLMGKGPMRNGLDAGYRVDLQRMFVNQGGVIRSDAMERFFGSVPLAVAFDAGEDILLEPPEFRTEAIICVDCAMLPIVALVRQIGERREEAERAASQATP